MSSNPTHLEGRIRWSPLFLLLVILFGAVLGSDARAVLYVDGNPGVPGPRDGTSWDRAYASIQTALDDLTSTPTEIWVADGAYSEIITMISGNEVYGGFTGYGED